MQRILNKKGMTTVFLAVIVIFSVLFPGISVYAGDLKRTVYNRDESGNLSGNDVYIHDEAGLLSDDEEERLMMVMEPITRFGSVVFYSTANNPYSDTVIMAENVFFRYFDYYESATMLFIDMDRREVAIYSDGDISKNISSSKSTTITDNIYTYLGNGEYFEGSKIAFEQINALLEGRRIPETMKVVCNILIALNIGFIICYIIASKTSKTESSEYLIMSTAKKDVRSNNPNQKFLRTTKTYIPPASSGGGGSHGGGGSRGGGFGGGGHHGSSGSHRF